MARVRPGELSFPEIWTFQADLTSYHKCRSRDAYFSVFEATMLFP